MERTEAGGGLQDVPYANGGTDVSDAEKSSGLEGMAVRAGPGEVEHRRTRQRQQDDSLGEMLKRGIVDHQLGLSVNFMLLVAMTYVLFPSLRTSMSAFFSLSYPSEHEGQFAQGPKDLWLVASFVVLFTAIRAACLDYLLLPLASWCGIESKKARVRFAEQGHQLLYYAFFWTWGLQLFLRDTPADVHSIKDLLISLWRDYPRLTTTGPMKLYYLSQLANWISQIAVINIEERRKDHYQMLTHHCVTIVLMGGSHAYRQHRVGNAILVLMDIVDLLLPLAKVFRYLKLQALCDCTFGLFFICWFVARHVAYLVVCWSIYAHVGKDVMPYGTYSTKDGHLVAADGGEDIVSNLLQPYLRPNAATVSFNANIRWQFLALLLGLQCITIGWFVMIVRVVARVLRGEGADDSRSDAEDEEEVDEQAQYVLDTDAADGAWHEEQQQASAGAERKYIEVESTSESYSRPPSVPIKRLSTSRKKSKGMSSALNLSDHKDILNRIGCLSEEQLAREREKREESMSPRLTKQHD